MELNSSSIRNVVHPTAGFASAACAPPSQKRRPAVRSEAAVWAKSQLNPQNRIDSLDYPSKPLWRIDGCTGLGTQYYAIPLFLRHVPPMRFDVFIPEEAAGSPTLRELLDLNVAFHTKDAARLRRLGISRYIVRALQAWIGAAQEGQDRYSALCRALPFGSRIIFENLPIDVSKMKITLVPTYYVERQLPGLAKLHQTLGLATPELVPPPIDISRLGIVRQLHDSVCLIRMQRNKDGEHGSRADADADKLWILKALTSGIKYLFVELRNLLQIEPHPNVISRPEYLVTKQCRFGGKTAVVGFILPFHAPGSLRDTLPLLRMHNHLHPARQLKWAIQLTSAVCHVFETGRRIFYPDLRLDNILLSAADDLIMVDFEQRGVWCEFAAPEVNAIEYVRILASDGGDGDNNNNSDDHAIPEITRVLYAALLDRLLPDWQALQACDDCAAAARPRGYENYNIPWLCLDREEQEAAMVYMLGRVLWCIFEGQAAPQRAAVWQSYRCEPDVEFPAFDRVPVGSRVRDLIDLCTRGRREALSGLVVRRGSRLVLRDRGGDEGDGCSRDEVLETARGWWQEEVRHAERFLEMRAARKAEGTWTGNYFGRPRLREVLAVLESLEPADVEPGGC